jgi:DNA-binding NarL/FixJ family response regulator
VRVVGLSVQDDPAMRRSMLEAGASAFVSKADDAETLVQAMLGALAGT